MIPPFDDNGYLPPGIHPASLDEIELRFGQQSETRQAQMESLRWLVEMLTPIGAKRLIINGSFTTSALEPNDVDCVVLMEDIQRRRDEEAETKPLADLPFLSVEFVRQRAFKVYIDRIFATDRTFQPKGMIEVISWT